MSNIDNLREALKFSPENVPLRYLLADTLLSYNNLQEAEEEYTILIRQTNEERAKFGLATTYFKRENIATCIVILEEIFSYGTDSAETYIMYAKCLIKENQLSKAVQAYQQALSFDPNSQDDDLDAQLRSKGDHQDNDDDLDDILDSPFFEKSEINFSHVGGMDNVKKEIDLKIIKPLQHAELYKAYGKKAGGGILLYGPPGCGKTFIAKATAGEVKANFLNIGLNDILDMWVGNSEKNLHNLFELARANTPCVLFIDEIDALGASRSDMKQSNSRNLINQFLQELDGINSNNDGVLIIGATNTPWNLDPAFRRPGRFDRIIFVPPPDQESREAILDLKLEGKPTNGKIDTASIAKKTNKFSGADIDAIIDIAIEQKIEQSFADGIPKPLETKDLLKATKIHKPSTSDWFKTAKNYAMFANDSGIYDDILKYMKITK